jgi:Zn-dependent protease
VHPLFWLVMALLSGRGNDLKGVLIFIACAFVSILVHEFGHGLASRFFGEEPNSIVLYSMGGYCECHMERMSKWQQVAVLAWGPGAGFLLLGLVLLAGRVAFGVSPIDSVARLGFGPGDPAAVDLHIQNRTIFLIYLLLIYINLMWGILNLFPIWPLDGGRITESLLTMYNRRNGRRWAHAVSLVTAGLLALWQFRQGNFFQAVFFAYFAFVNYQMLQSLHDYARYGDPYGDGADWWKR